MCTDGLTKIIQDIAIQCNSHYLTKAALEDGQAPVFRYVFNTLPAIHGYDAGYTVSHSPPLFPNHGQQH